MIATFVAAVCLCVTPPALPPVEPVLLSAAETAPERAALREIAHAYDVVAFVDALTAPSERPAGPPLEVAGPRRSPPPASGPATSTGAGMTEPSAIPATGRCGGDLPSCSIMECESGGNITAQNPRSSASGKWQIIDSTWANHGGYPTAASAPESVQDDKARQLWAGGAGRGHWAQCL